MKSPAGAIWRGFLLLFSDRLPIMPRAAHRIAGVGTGDEMMANYTGTPGDDFHFGTEEADVIIGLSGADILFGEGGNDLINGGNGADDLSGGDGDDVLNGNAGDDILRGGDGKDRFNGGEGFDRISFFDPAATQGVIADLRRQLVLNDGFGNREHMTSIEGLGAGTVFADRFYGDDNYNLLYGGVADRLFGFGGNDMLNMRGAGGAIIDGGDGIDEILFLSQREVLVGGRVVTENATHGISVDLSRNLIIDDGFGERGKIFSVENVAATTFDDRIIGSDVGNILYGIDGNDRVSGGNGGDALLGGEGNDVLHGDDGSDTLFGGSGEDRLYGDDGADRLDGGAGRDTLIGGAGADIFAFVLREAATSEAPADRILDFEQKPLGADGVPTGPGDVIAFVDVGQSLRFIGTDAFSGTAGEIRYEIHGNNTFVYVETDGVAGANMVINLIGTFNLTSHDFVI